MKSDKTGSNEATNNRIVQVELFASHQTPSDENLRLPEGKAVTRKVCDLSIHQSIEKLNLLPGEEYLRKMLKLGRPAILPRVLITPDGVIVDGYDIWMLAKERNEIEISCVEISASEQDCLRLLLFSQNKSPWMCSFCKIELALELEPFYRKMALENQIAGGKGKGLSKLADPQRIDTRRIIARTAGVGVGNVTKVKDILKDAIAPVIKALRNRRISIHRGTQIAKVPRKKQLEILNQPRYRKNFGARNRRLVSNQGSNLDTVRDLLRNFYSNCQDLLKPDECERLRDHALAELDQVLAERKDEDGFCQNQALVA
jgi:hypothetical protein